MKLTREKALKLGAEMWRWLEENPKITPLVNHLHKLDWPGWKRYEDTLNNACFACSECNRACTNCMCLKLWKMPIKYVTSYNTPCVKEKSPYYKWYTVKSLKTQAKYARIIAEFHEKELTLLNSVKSSKKSK